eukprot:COSAG01_NODE_830_length_13271_cov_2.845278_3_plen_626_part_00
MCARQDGVGVVTEGVVEFVARALQKDLAQRFGSAAEMLASLEHSLTTSGVQRFDLFISYRVWCDKDFAQALFRAMSASAMRGGREFSMRVYLDKVRLLDGQRFDIGFIRGRKLLLLIASRVLLPAVLAQSFCDSIWPDWLPNRGTVSHTVAIFAAVAASTVFAPLLSAKCIEGFLELEHTDREDFVLMEWLVALELQRRGIIKAILPISIGEQGRDGTFSQSFFEELRNGKVGGRPLPDVVSHKTTAKAQEFLGMLKPPLALSGSTLSVKGTVMELLKFQAVLLHFENDAVTKKVQQISGGGGSAAAAAAQLVRAGSQPLPALVAPLPLSSQKIALSHAATVCAERAAAVVLAHGAVVDQAAGTESDPERLARDKSLELRVKDLKIKQLESQLQKQSDGSTVTIPEGLPPQQVPEPEPEPDEFSQSNGSTGSHLEPEPEPEPALDMEPEPEPVAYEAPGHLPEAEPVNFAQMTTDDDVRKFIEGRAVSVGQIREVSFRSCAQVTDESLRVVAKACPLLTSLDLGRCNKVTDDGIRATAVACQQLTSLDLWDCGKITDEGLRATAAACSQMTSLSVDYCNNVTDEGLGAVFNGCPALAKLSVRMCRKVTAKGLQPFKERGCSVYGP